MLVTWYGVRMANISSDSSRGRSKYMCAVQASLWVITSIAERAIEKVGKVLTTPAQLP